MLHGKSAGKRWIELPFDTIATTSSLWHATTLADVVDDETFASLVAKALAYGCVWCETDDVSGERTKLLVLRGPGPEFSIGDTVIVPEQVRRDNIWILALTPDPSTGQWPPLPPGPVTATVHERRWTVHIGAQELRPSMVWSRKLRDWAWAWTPTVGPAILDVIVDASEDAIDQWFRTHASRYYELTSTDVWGRRFVSKISDRSIMRLRPNTIAFLRDYTSPTARQHAADHKLLAGLIAGALPVTGFDVIDGDYLCTCATGFSPESLQAYLHANRRLRYDVPHPWKMGLTSLSVDALAAATEVEVEAILTRALQNELKTEAPLDELLKTTALEALPRVIAVEYKGEIDVNALAARMPSLRARVRWHWTAAFARAKRTLISG